MVDRICSACGPAGWHGRFSQETYDPEREGDGNNGPSTIDWQFTTSDARTKLKHPLPATLGITRY